jgi:CRISPR/Cas system-associated exonuclease Cas4 (RecB family)
MKPEEAILVSLLSYTEELKKDDYVPNKIYMGSLADCDRDLWISMYRPKVLLGVEMIYRKIALMGPSMEYIVGMGNKVEDILRNQLNVANIKILGDQSHVKDFDGRVSGRIDFGVEIPSIGLAVIDAKGMSDKVFNNFINSNTLKEFKLSYYYQLLYYIHMLEIDLGYILGINRSTGKIHAKSIRRLETRGDFLSLRSRLENIINTKIEDFETLPQVTDENCKYCDFKYVCKPHLV